MSWRDERRADRAQQAQLRREDRAAERAEQRRDREFKAQQRRERGARRRAAVAGGLRWLAARPVDVLMAAIIIVPAVLAWTAMADYGKQIYGPIGVLLPLFTEAAMWAFAFAAHRSRQSATGALQVGIWTFAGVAGVLNFLHGLVIGGVVAGIVMAAVSVGGVVAHQLLTTTGLRTAEQRRTDRTQKLAAKRVARMERAAVRRAVGELADDGSVRLLHKPGLVTLRRGMTGRRRLADTTVPGVGEDGPTTNAVGDELEVQIQAWLADQTDSTDPRPATVTTSPDPAGDLQESRESTPSIPDPKHRSIEQLRDELREAVQADRVDPTSAEDIRKTLRCGIKRARQLRDEWNDDPGVPAAA